MAEKAADKTEKTMTTAGRSSTSSAPKPQEPRAENMGGAPGGESLEGGAPPTGDEPSSQAKKLNEELQQQHPSANIVDPLYNPTTPDGSPPPNNLPGPHGPQGVEHLQEDPAKT